MKLKGSAENLIAVYERADDIDYSSGLSSYLKYNKLMKDLAAKFGCTLEQVTAVFVSTSPNNDYSNNLRSTVSVLDGWKKGMREDQIVISTYNHCKKRALSFLNGFDFLESTKGLKIRSFYGNIVNPLDKVPVTVDGHMISAWTGKRYRMKEVADLKFKYKEVAEDTRRVASNYGLVPCQFQAIVWFTWKRINNIVYKSNLNLFGDHWGLDIDVNYIKPFVKKVI